METVKPFAQTHNGKISQGIMADVEVYGWVLVKAYHAIWLQQIVNSRAQWSDVDAKLKFRRALVWHAAHQEA